MNRIQITLKCFFSVTLFILGFTSLTARAQQCDEVTINEARKYYEMGKFNETIQTLEGCLVSGFNDQQKIEASRISAFSWLALDSMNLAKQAVMQILQLQPTYEANLFDPQAYILLVNHLKARGIRQVVTSVSKIAENINETPATIVVVTREQIKERGYTDLVELIKDVPGFDMSLFYGSELVNLYQRGFRQNNTEKTLLLIDGVEENDLWTNWAYLDKQYPLSNIERVEIIYGPASTMYGPNAFAGVINVITRNSLESIRDDQSIGVDARLLYGSYNTKSVDLSISGVKSKVSFSLTGRLFNTDEHDLSSQSFFDYNPDYYDGVDYARIMNLSSNGFNYLIDNDLPLAHEYYQLSADSTAVILTEAGIAAARELDKSAYNQQVNGAPIGFSNHSKNMFLKGKVNVGNFTFGFQTWKYSRGSLTQYTDAYVASADNGFTWVPQLSYFYTTYENQINDHFYISNLTTYRIHTLTQDSKFVSVLNYARGNRKIADLVNGIAPAWSTNYAYENSTQLRTELKTVYSPMSKFNLVSGLELRNGTLQGGYLLSASATPMDSALLNPSPLGGNSYSTWDVGLYSQATWQALQQLKLTLGLRYDYNRVRTSAGFGSVISPRLALVYTPGKFTFKAIYSSGIMNVSNWTKYSSAGNRIPNPTLKTENIKNYELSALYSFSDYFHLEFNLYQSRIDDVVGTVPINDGSGLTHNDNIGEFIINGAQLGGNYRLRSFSAYLNYTYCDPTQTYSETGAVDNRVGDIAAHQINVGLNQEFWSQLNVNLRMNYSGERKVGAGTTVPMNSATFPAVAIFNSAITWHHPRVMKDFEIQLLINNLFNTDYFHPGTKAADGISGPTEILQKGRHVMIQALYHF
jgi:outer membrane receptor for ferrienterochelin and colicins